ncbi:MAG: TIGR04255 family protein [Xenococcaceae cyanobacterium]
MSIAKFREPPLREIVFAVNFEISDFSSIHFGLFWQTIKDRFTETFDIAEEPTITEDALVLFNLPTVWYRSSKKDRFIRLKDGYFAYHYRYQSNQYPHFENLFAEFLKEWQNLKSWWLELSEETIVASGYQLNYLNIIDERSGWESSKDNNKVFKFTDLGLNNSYENLISYNCNLEFLLPDNLGILQVLVEQQTVESLEDSEEKDIAIFSLSAQKSDEEIEDIELWFNSSHEYIIKYFLDLTQEEIQKKWGRYNV